MPHDGKGYDSAHLTPRDYLNASINDPAPFEFCPVFGPGDPVAERRGQWGLLKSRLHQGSNARVQKVVQKALSGLPVTISVLGSSVSACHGAGDDPVATKCYPSKFFDWWNSIFPHPASELTNGASRKTDSAYYAYCSAHHLPDQTDLVILEFDSADPNTKGVLYNDYIVNPEGARKEFYLDPILASPGGHDLIADVLTSYMMQQICSGWAANMGHAFDVPYMGEGGSDTTTGGPQLLGGVGLRKGAQGVNEGDGESVNGQELKHVSLKVPPARIHDRPSDILQFREIDPFCVSANDLINPLPPSLFYGSGWHAFHPAKGSNDERHYWYAEQPTSRIRIPMRLSAGDVAIYYIQNPEDKPGGSALCWVDDNVGGGVELQGNAEVSEPTPTLTIIDRHVSKGSHFVECQLLGEEGKASAPFKILGIFST
ncbi:hypothetical protein QFC24_004013 [Naganishia onofrii]|uniref:Uncharacterized protein n=1 Tax=Naganishia onofrii TaxID=1851511 RepID=A0ACC2XH91_9TREE|nr:hypothetical protein QFC24_004013 [Naganishia onofrii]